MRTCPLLIGALLTCSCSHNEAKHAVDAVGMKNGVVVLRAGGRTLRVEVEVASTPEQRNHGLMFRRHLNPYQGMLFVFDEEEVQSFWMKNTRIPLSIAYAAADGTILTIADMRPMSLKGTPSGSPALYALEVNQGWFEAHGVNVGDKLGKLPGPSAH